MIRLFEVFSNTRAFGWTKRPEVNRSALGAEESRTAQSRSKWRCPTSCPSAPAMPRPGRLAWQLDTQTTMLLGLSCALSLVWDKQSQLRRKQRRRTGNSRADHLLHPSDVPSIRKEPSQGADGRAGDCRPHESIRRASAHLLGRPGWPGLARPDGRSRNNPPPAISWQCQAVDALSPLC